jgi:hypothetical protein
VTEGRGDRLHQVFSFKRIHSGEKAEDRRSPSFGC